MKILLSVLCVVVSYSNCMEKQVVTDPALAPTDKERSDISLAQCVGCWASQIAYDALVTYDKTCQLAQFAKPSATIIAGIGNALSVRDQNGAIALLREHPTLDVNYASQDGTLLQQGVEQGKSLFVTELLSGKYNVDVNACAGSMQLTPLELACQNNRCDYVMQLLLAKNTTPLSTITTVKDGKAEVQSLQDWLFDREEYGCLALLVKRGLLTADTHLCGAEKNVLQHVVSQQSDRLTYRSSKGAVELVQACLEQEDYVYQDEISKALQSRNQAVIEALLSSSKVVVPQKQVRDLLCWAIECSSEEIAEKMIPLCGDFDVPDAHGLTPLNYAVDNESEKVVELLLAKGAKVLFRDVESALKTANAPILQSLLANFTDMENFRKDMIAKHRMTPLEYVMHKKKSDYKECVKVLLDKGADPNDFQKKSLLALAVKRKKRELVQLFIAHKANVNVVTKSGRTLVHRAAQRRKANILEALLQAGAPIQANKRGAFPLYYVLAGESDWYPSVDDCIKVLLDHGHDVGHTLEIQGVRKNIGYIELAIGLGLRSSTLQLLHDRGAPLHGKNRKRNSALHTAVEFGNVDAIKWLVKNRVDVAAQNRKGLTPLAFMHTVHEFPRQRFNCLYAMLRGLSNQVGGAISLEEIIESFKQAQLSNPKKELSLDLDAPSYDEPWAFDPFEYIARNCKDDCVPEELDEVKQKISEQKTRLLHYRVQEAVKNNNIERVKGYVQAGVDLIACKMDTGVSLLQWAAEQGNEDFLEYLLAMPSIKDGNQEEMCILKNVAFDAVTTGDCAQLLIGAGAKASFQGLLKAVQADKEDIVALMLQHMSCALSLQEKAEIMRAGVTSGNVQTVDLLVGQGCWLEPEHIIMAVECANVELVRYLRVMRPIMEANALSLKRDLFGRFREPKSLACLAVEQKNIDLLKAVIMTADNLLLRKVVKLDWVEGLELLIANGKKPKHAKKEYSGDLLVKAISSEAVNCCKVLLSHIKVTPEHLVKAAKSCVEIMEILLLSRDCSQDLLDKMLLKAVRRGKPEMCRLLLQRGAQPTGCTNLFNISCLHSIADTAQSFSSGFEFGPDWHTRYRRILALQVWINRYLKHTDVEISENMMSLLEKSKLDTLLVLMTTPIYANPQEHKTKMKELLSTQISVEKYEGQIEKYGTPYEHAQKKGNSTTFNNLFDPEKIEQWYGAIDRAYAKRELEEN